MGIVADFNNWPLHRQIQVIFIISSIFLAIIMILITNYQLGWLYSSTYSQLQDLLKSTITRKITTIGQSEKLYLTQELNNLITSVKQLRNLAEIALGYSTITPSFTQSTMPIQNTEILSGTMNYTTAVYYSSLPLTESGIEILDKISSLNPIFPFLGRPEIVNLYMGFITDEILYVYPGRLITDLSYNPLTREWFYTSQLMNTNAIFTEPYSDSLASILIFSIAEAIKDSSNNVIGVASLDVDMESLAKIITEVSVLDTGFAMLLSSEGVILTMPPQWGYNGLMRIDEEVYTGISNGQWRIFQNSSDGQVFESTFKDGTQYYIAVFSIRPYSDINNITHYLLIFANQTEVYFPINDLNSFYYTIYNLVFWFVLTIGLIVMGVTSTLIWIYTKKSDSKIRQFIEIFDSIIRRAHFSNITKFLSLKDIKKNNSDLQRLVTGTQTYLKKIKNTEKANFGIKWHSTRPTSYYLYNQWLNEINPFSNLKNHSFKWRKMIPYLFQDKHLKMIDFPK